MEALRQAALNVITAALICAVLVPLVQEGTSKELLRIICGFFMVISLLSHIRNIDLQMLTQPVQDAAIHAPQEAASGISHARTLQEDIIKSRCEEYILDKASGFGASVTVEIRLSDGDIPYPESVYIRGRLPENTKKSLQKIIIQDLGIAEEDQIWIG